MSRRRAWQFSEAPTRTWAARAGKPLVIVQMCRSWTSSTPGTAAISRPQPGDITIERPGREPEVVAAQPQDPFALELEAFRAAVEDGAPLPFGRDDAVAQARAIEAVRAASAVA